MSYYFSKTLPVSFDEAVRGRTEVAAIDPVASMQAIENPALKRAAEQVGAKLKKFIEGL